LQIDGRLNTHTTRHSIPNLKERNSVMKMLNNKKQRSLERTKRETATLIRNKRRLSNLSKKKEMNLLLRT